MLWDRGNWGALDNYPPGTYEGDPDAPWNERGEDDGEESGEDDEWRWDEREEDEG